jgi:pentatricopeptide repeat protein
MYIRAQSLESAQRVFDKTSDQDIVSWTLILAGYIDNEQENHALEIFGQLVVENFRHDEFTLMNAVNACASLAALDKGKMVHALIVEIGFEKCDLVCNALINMYSKSGSTVDARGVLDAMPARNVVSWNSMISGYAEHGQGEAALQLVNQMQLERISLNRISSLGILSACSHTGLSIEGYGHFKFMNQAHGVKPTMDHYACMVDLVGRTGHLEEALCFIRKMPVEPSVDVWKALLRVSHIHSNPSLGQMAAEEVLNQDPTSATTYVMLSNIYGSLGLWNECAQIIKDSEGQSDSKAGWL